MLQVIVLGLVQGLTEFLPVSSSGHLVVVPYLLSWEQPPLAFDVALHFGTLMGVLAYFARDLWILATHSLGLGVRDGSDARHARTMVGLLLLASIPAAIAGALLEPFFESVFKQPVWVSFFLLVTAGLLVTAERLRRRRVPAAVGGGADGHDQLSLDVGRDEHSAGLADALTIGTAQALAIFPGISRSGATIAAGMMRGLSRQGATRFSFLMSIPVILGATALKVGELVGEDAERLYSNAEVAVGVAVAAGSGYWAIRFLLRLVSTEELTPFARYVVVVAVVLFGASFFLGPWG